VFFPNKIELQIEIFQNSKKKIGLVYGAYEEVDVKNGKIRVMRPKFKGNVYKILGINHIGTPSTVMLSKEAIKKIGKFDINLNHKEDIDFYFRLSKYFEVSFTKEIVTKYYFHSGSASKNDFDRLTKMLSFISKHKNQIIKPRVRWSELQERLGELYLLNNYRVKALILLISAYFNRPFRIKILIKILIMLIGKKTFNI